MSAVEFARQPDQEHRLRSLPGAPPEWEVEVHAARYSGGRYHVLTSRDEITRGDERWHISISGAHDVPPWRALVAIGHARRPGVCFVVGVPPESWWMNIHPNVLHLWELKDAALAAQWLSESLGHTPS